MKIVLKYLTLTIVVLLMLVVFSVTSFAESYADFYGGDLVFESLPEEVAELFEELGVTSAEFEPIFNIGFKDVWRVAKQLITGAVESPLSSFVRIVILIIVLAVFECYIPDDHKIKSLIRMSSNLVCVISIIKPLSVAVTSSVASVTITENFMIALIPVLTSVMSFSGNSVLAGTFQMIAFSAAQIISVIVSEMFVPLIGVMLSLDVTGSLVPEFRLSGLSSVIKKTITVIISLVATLFVSFLGMKGGLANVADTFARKGIKLVISSAVPVVGGALSEAYSGVMGSLLLVKSTLGVFGVAAIILINLPSCIQLLFWIFTLRVAGGLADLFEQDGISGLLKSVAATLVLLNVIIILVAVLFVISTVLILILKAN